MPFHMPQAGGDSGLVEMEGRRQSPLRLLIEAVACLQRSQPHQAADLLLFFLQRCWAAATGCGS